jgi:hypothetical protein
MLRAHLAPFTQDPWTLRNEASLFTWIRVKRIRDVSCGTFRRSLREKDAEKILLLLEAQRNGMFMYTSCGWFFNDLAASKPHRFCLRVPALELLRKRAAPIWKRLPKRPPEAGATVPNCPGATSSSTGSYPHPALSSGRGDSGGTARPSSSYYAFTVNQTSHVISGAICSAAFRPLVEDRRTTVGGKGAPRPFLGGIGRRMPPRENELPPLRPFKKLFTRGISWNSPPHEDNFPLGPWKLGILPRMTGIVAREALH